MGIEVTLGRNNLTAILTDLANHLAATAPDSRRELVICGGAALIALGTRSVATRDIDILEPTIDEPLRAAAEAVRVRYGLRTDWLNNGPASLVPLLPKDWRSRLQVVFDRPSLVVRTIGRPELIISKLFAEADRQQDLADIVGIAPTVAELRAAEALVATFDGHPDWPTHVERTIAKILRALEGGK